MVLVIETQIATEETTWTLILEGPSQKLSALQSLATSRQYAPLQLHCTPGVALREILAERSHSLFLSMWTNLCRGVPVPGPVGSVWHCYALLWRGCGKLVLRLWHSCGTILWKNCSTPCDVVVVHWYTMLWFIFVTPLLYTLWVGTLCDNTALHFVIPPVVLCRPGASVMLVEPADMLLLGRGIAILYLGCYMLL